MENKLRFVVWIALLCFACVRVCGVIRFSFRAGSVKDANVTRREEEEGAQDGRWGETSGDAG